MYLQDLIGDKHEIIQAAMLHPALAVKRKPTLEAALKAVVAQLETTAARAVAVKVEADLQEVYDMYTIENGEHADAPAEQKDDWSSGLDDRVETLLEPYNSFLSADWLGRMTIGTNLWEEEAVSKLAASTGREVFKQLTYGKTPAQALANAGIVAGDVEIYFDQHMAPKPAEEVKKMEDASLDGVMDKIRAYVGLNDIDLIALYDNFDQAMDDDDILAQSAARRLGISDDEVEIIRLLALEHGADAPTKAMEMFESGKPIPPSKSEVRKKARLDKAAKTETGDILDGKKILTLVKDHSAITDTELATALGVSRSSYNNWLGGKNPFLPTVEQRETLRNRIAADVNGLYAALCAIDGIPVDKDFQ